MTRLASLQKLGFYPFPGEHQTALVSLFQPRNAPAGRMLDPCAGEGEALHTLATLWGLTPYANELDPERAAVCRRRFGHQRALEGDLFDIRTELRAFSVVFCNPPYAQNIKGSAEKRLEFEMLRHSWKWVAPDGWIIWVVYNTHMTERAAKFLSEQAQQVDVYRIPGQHLDVYTQIVVVAQKGHPTDAEALSAELVQSCQAPDTLPELRIVPEPIYKLPPGDSGTIQFRLDEMSGEAIQRYLVEGGLQTERKVLQQFEVSIPNDIAAPIMPPRTGQQLLLVAAGALNGTQIAHEGSPALVRGRVRMAHVDTTPEADKGKLKVITRKAATTITVLKQTGDLQVIQGSKGKALAAFIQQHRGAFLRQLEANYPPVYDFDSSPYQAVFDPIFRNRPMLPGRKLTGLLESQKHAVAAVLTGLKQRKGMILCAEMGSGKSPMGSAVIVGLHQRGDIRPGQFVACMVPPHLVKKWVKELRDVAPGCNPVIVESVDDIEAFIKEVEAEPARLHVLIMSREKAKSTEGISTAVVLSKLPHPKSANPDKKHYRCPSCGSFLGRNIEVSYGETVFKPDPLSKYKDSKQVCRQRNPRGEVCGQPLWAYKRSWSKPKKGSKYPKRNPTWALAWYLADRHADKLGVVCCDELHELKNWHSDQGTAFRKLAQAAYKVVGLTGTLFDGKVSNLFSIEWVFNPKMHKAYSIEELGVSGAMTKWVRDMGTLEEVIDLDPSKTKAGKRTGVERSGSSVVKEVPGFSPKLLGWLHDHTVFFTLPDLGLDLPTYEEIPVAVDWGQKSLTHYSNEVQKMKDHLLLCKQAGDNSFMGSFIYTALRWPSAAHKSKKVVHHLKLGGGDSKRFEVAEFVSQGAGTSSKEEKLLHIIEGELAAGRKVVVYVSQSGKLDLRQRLAKLIQVRTKAARVEMLDAGQTDKREAKVERYVEQGCNVLLTNPNLVKTGLDLVDFQTIIFFEIDYSMYTCAQAARRHWRATQTQACKVYYIYYRGTYEQAAVKLISEKQGAAGLLLGNLGEGGLADLASISQSVEAELAKAIDTGADIESSAEAMFRQSAADSLETSFYSGFTNTEPDADAVTPTVILKNVIRKRFYLDGVAHEVVGYGPRTEASYRVKHLVSGEVTLMDASLVLAAKHIARDLPLSIKREAKPTAKPTPKPLPRVPLLSGYHLAKAKLPQAVALVQCGDFYCAYGPDAERVAQVLNSVVDTRGLGGQSVKHTAIPAKDLVYYCRRLTKAGLRVAVARKKAIGDAPKRQPMPVVQKPQGQFEQQARKRMPRKEVKSVEHQPAATQASFLAALVS